jgi:septum site-determining protein MinC
MLGLNDDSEERCGKRALNVLRGTAAGLELVFSGAFEEAWSEIEARLGERPDFYRGSRAVAIFDGFLPEDDGLRRVLESTRSYGIALGGVHGGPGLEVVAARCGMNFLGGVPRPSVASFERKRAARAERLEITEKARSLDADFAGARADIANRRARGEPSVPRPVFAQAAPGAAAPGPAAAAVSTAATPTAGTLYHRGTLRGGQTLQQLGSIVVVGDVNPGAELVASGDIVVFGALRGTAHAGAQGDATARVFALELAATQLRIATLIAADDGPRSRPVEPEVAFIRGERIARAPYAEIGSAP